ncbi:MAG: hypothetical protein IT287_08365, partial [Bdellovibrionaceae bacterium]|nr:hypothetical protein [Pseudobdellovibrionaceae bacterium]
LYRDLNTDNKDSIMMEIKDIQSQLPRIANELGLDETQIKYIERELQLQIIHFSSPHPVR